MLTQRTIAVCLQILIVAVCTSGNFLQCPPCEEVNCEPVSCSEDLQTLDLCGCCTVCASGNLERCGGSGSIPCEAGLVCKYRLGSIMEEDKTGVCEHELCSRTVCGYRQVCRANLDYGTYYVINCICPRYYNRNCAGKYNPVCANNQVTYTSLCHLHMTECRESRFIGIQHMGACEEPDPVSILPVKTKDLLPKQDRYVLQQQYFPDRAPGSILHVDPVSNPPVKTKDLLLKQDRYVLQHRYFLDRAPEAVPARACTYYDKKYLPNTLTQIDPNDHCRYVLCNGNYVPMIVLVPGCPGDAPPDFDPGINTPPVNGSWSEWSEWTVCEGGCYNSTQSRYRTCTNPKPRYEGAPCDGSPEETRKCFPDRCNISCDYTRWSKWSKCSVSCGGGVTIRTRSISNQLDEEIKLKACDLSESMSCNSHVCPTGRCKKRSLGANSEDFDHLPVTRMGVPCFTEIKHEVFYCYGDCLNKSGRNSTDCCVATRHRSKKERVYCGVQRYVHTVKVQSVKACRCRDCHTGM